ncbi:MAG: succinyl-diaminopimelate desuccinylase [Geminicoccaceae bacterium]|nr:succinyl-diaminopimelate desuccinylase [Geminicoccaceae bacterium]
MPAIDPVTLTAELIRCPSVTPADAGAQVLLGDVLSDLGFEVHHLPFNDVPNLFATIGRGAPHLLFAGHTDVVPPGDSSSWSVDPFAAVTVDGQLIGRGAADMKSGIAAFVAAVARHRAGGARGGTISLLITGDEEGPAIDGTVRVLDWARDQGLVFDGCIVGEPTCPAVLGEMAKIGRRGSLTGRLTVRGRQGHTAYPARADNAAHKLVAMLRALIDEPLDAGNERFEPSTLQVATIDIGNPATNVVPGEAKAVFNIRFNDEHDRTSLEALIRRRCAGVASEFALLFEGNADPFLTTPGRLTELLAEAVESVTGRRPVFSTSGGTSDARFVSRHCPVVEFGIVGATMHQSDERVAVRDIEGLTAIYEAFLDRFLRPSP